jgi:hypothetical protein
VKPTLDALEHELEELAVEEWTDRAFDLGGVDFDTGGR